MQFGVIGLSLLFTFLIPATQWLFGSAGSAEIGSSISIIIVLYIWYLKANNFPFLPSLLLWKVFYWVGSLSAIVLVFINIQAEPVSQITGQARCALSVVNVIVLLPLAEEMIFRGHMWSFFEKISVEDRFKKITLLSTSLLFGIGHLGYWLQFYWPLPIDAIFHSLLMVFAGFILGLFRWISDSLMVPMVVHVVANGIVLLNQ